MEGVMALVILVSSRYSLVSRGPNQGGVHVGGGHNSV